MRTGDPGRQANVSAARVRLPVIIPLTDGCTFPLPMYPCISFLSQQRQVSGQFINQFFGAADAHPKVLEAVAVCLGGF